MTETAKDFGLISGAFSTMLKNKIHMEQSENIIIQYQISQSFGPKFKYENFKAEFKQVQQRERMC